MHLVGSILLGFGSILCIWSDRFYRISDRFYASEPILSGFGSILIILYGLYAISERINSANQMDGNLLWETVGGTALHAIVKYIYIKLIAYWNKGRYYQKGSSIVAPLMKNNFYI